MTKPAVLEVATLQIIPGQEARFEAAFEQAQRFLDRAQGHLSHELQRCLEDPGRYLLFITWQTLKDHTVAFRESPEHEDWKRLLGPFYSERPGVIHCVAV